MTDPIERLKSLFRPKTETESSYKVYAQAKYYRDFRKVYIPHEPFIKKIPGMEARAEVVYSSRERNEDHQKVVDETNKERSIRRSKKTIRDYVWCNKFELFTTFTFNCKPCGQNCNNAPCICDEKCLRFDPDICKRRMSNWLHLQQKRKGRFQYLIIPEFHDDGKAIHFHALFKNYPGELVRAINPKTGKKLVKKGRKVYSIPSYNLGLEEVYKIEKTPESHAKVGNYIRKYITKDMPLFKGKHRYWSSNDLTLPVVEDNPDDWIVTETPENGYVSMYGIFLEFLNAPRHLDKS